jgi:hypothetical protein
MSSRYVAYQPGDTIPVEVTDGSSPGDLVEVSGEGESFTQVQQATDDAAALGMLVSSDSTTDSMVKVFKPVLYLNPEGSYTPSAGDLVAERAGGTVSDTLGDGTTAVTRSDAYGIVMATNVRSLHVGDRVAVALYR